MSSGMPSPSVSLETGQPWVSFGPGCSGQASSESGMPSPSPSGQPLNSGRPARSGQASSRSGIPSPSRSVFSIRFFGSSGFFAMSTCIGPQVFDSRSASFTARCATSRWSIAMPASPESTSSWANA